MGSLRNWMLGAAVLVGAAGVGATTAQAAEFGFRVRGPVAYVPPCPGPGYAWVNGYWNGGAYVNGYWNAPELTASVTSDGWINTGDIGFIDPDGYVYLRGRSRDGFPRLAFSPRFEDEIEVWLQLALKRFAGHSPPPIRRGAAGTAALDGIGLPLTRHLFQDIGVQYLEDNLLIPIA